MNNVLIANILTLFGAIFLILSANAKENKKVIKYQTIMLIIYGVSNLFLGSYAGVTANSISVARNIFASKNKYNIVIKLIFTGLLAILGFITNNIGFIGYLPIVSAVLFSLFLDTKNEKHLKYLIITTQLLWLVHDIIMKGYVFAIFDVITCITAIISIIKLNQVTKNTEEALEV